MKCVSFVLASKIKRFPFEWNNPIGYSIAIIHEYITCGYEFYVITCALALGIAAYCFVTAITKDLQLILHSINDEARANESQSSELKILFSVMAVLLNTTLNGTSGYSLVFIACELGQRMTDAFEKIDYSFD